MEVQYNTPCIATASETFPSLFFLWTGSIAFDIGGRGFCVPGDLRSDSYRAPCRPLTPGANSHSGDQHQQQYNIHQARQSSDPETRLPYSPDHLNTRPLNPHTCTNPDDDALKSLARRHHDSPPAGELGSEPCRAPATRHPTT